MIADLSPAIGFLSQPIDGGGTYTYATAAGVFLRAAEEMAGPRDKDWTFLGVEFFGEEANGAVPHLWYPGNCGNVVIRLTQNVATNYQRGVYQFAHEVCHLISPSGSGYGINLDEGFATYLGNRLAAQYVGFVSSVTPKYAVAYDAFVRLLAHSQSALRDIRAIEPRIWCVTPAVIAQAVPGIDPGLAKTLCDPF